MTHLPYIIAAYGFTAVVVGVLGFGAAARLRRARRLLAGLDRRGRR